VQSAPLPRLAWMNANLIPPPATLVQSISFWKRETSIPVALVPALACPGTAITAARQSAAAQNMCLRDPRWVIASAFAARTISSSNKGWAGSERRADCVKNCRDG
jgi:hypothetical protein